MKRRILLFLLLPLSFGCQMASPSQSQPETPQRRFEKLQQKAVALPGSEVRAAGGNLTISYPQESLFSPGSVIPLVGGAEALDPLADLLSYFPEGVWDAEVQTTTSHGPEYDAVLAKGRSELLQRYLRNRGVLGKNIIWQAQGGNGPALALTLRPPQSPENNSLAEKE